MALRGPEGIGVTLGVTMTGGGADGISQAGAKVARCASVVKIILYNKDFSDFQMQPSTLVINLLIITYEFS